MRYYIGVTDGNWYKYLASLLPDEVNFWRPTKTTPFRGEQWSPFLFKLHSPNNYIVGGGFFVRYEPLPIWLAWESFEERNGTNDIDELQARVLKYSGKQVDLYHEIGCIVLAEPFFFEQDDWIPQPPNWSGNIVSGKYYDTEDEIGSDLWLKVEQRLLRASRNVPDKLNVPSAIETYARYGAATLVYPRLGQGAFRLLVTDAYESRCAISYERTLPALEAAHIKPYARSGGHEVRNGLLLRADIHRLFELGYITITDSFHVEVSRRIKEEFSNGKDYYVFHGKQCGSLPNNPNERPAPEYVQWHNDNIYKS